MNSKYNNRLINFFQIAGDFVLINLSFLLAYYIKFGSLTAYLSDKYFTLLLVFNLCWFLSTYIVKAYENNQFKKVEKIILNLIQLFVLQALLITAFWVFRKAYYYSREHLLTTFALLVASVSLWRFLFQFQFNRFRKKGLNFRNVIIVGAGQLSNELLGVFKNNKELGYKFLGFFSDNKSGLSDLKGRVNDVFDYCKIHKVDEMYCSISDLNTDQLRRLTEFSHNNLIRIKMIPDVRGFLNRHLTIDFYEHVPVLTFRNIPLDDYANRFIKRLFDLAFSLFVILFVLSWLYPVLAVVIKLNSKGPVLFKQMRSGKNNHDFKCLKFRTMHVNTEADHTQAIKKDSRITNLGLFLRKTSLDEMPQFFNVFYGHMSIVGPRPHMKKHTEEYAVTVDKYMFRHFVKPGITGLAQVKGLRGETKSSLAMEHRIRLDTLYIENWSLILDIKIIVLTIINVFKGDEKAY
ncbi:MAG: undecaprenyl-phosphate glucose phosphotransferase [Bacteroidota bacterium]|nr:undecaprenyl-phosphate glucose phosphotransferase [Bacteroidota bacterium]MEE3097794.1 undecaprenyl-phosphate glucose phosphotransferase [Bacteroidota bacterium]